jgi:hypothetical protein
MHGCDRRPHGFAAPPDLFGCPTSPTLPCSYGAFSSPCCSPMRASGECGAHFAMRAAEEITGVADQVPMLSELIDIAKRGALSGFVQAVEAVSKRPIQY